MGSGDIRDPRAHHCAGVVLIATFETNEHRAELLRRFAHHTPAWEQETLTDWIQHTRDAWPARIVGAKLFLAPKWCNDPTPEGRERIVHNPGQACGTGEHSCTQLALRALEECVTADSRVIDVGTGSGILAIAAVRLGAASAIGVDINEASLHTARENFLLNDLTPKLSWALRKLSQRVGQISRSQISAQRCCCRSWTSFFGLRVRMGS